ncbi:MAG TPA: AAA family ATPase, partial [Xanthomonadaceae bacterium]|nr:AAA family ATPase [Xanthomonadaceae bacterium]
MLRHLAIRDFAVVSATELEFGPGLTVISGETGAGKSLLVDALDFLSGSRADSGMVRHGAERAELDAQFDLADAPAAAAWLREAELDDGNDCQLRRTLRADGGSRAWINGRPVTLAQLSELAALLVEIHGQHAHQALLARASQLALLDAYGRHDAELATVREAAQAWASLLRERELLSNQGDVSERIAWLEHQLGELQRESLEPEAIAELVAGHRRHAHAAGLISA